MSNWKHLGFTAAQPQNVNCIKLQSRVTECVRSREHSADSITTTSSVINVNTATLCWELHCHLSSFRLPTSAIYLQATLQPTSAPYLPFMMCLTSLISNVVINTCSRRGGGSFVSRWWSSALQLSRYQFSVCVWLLLHLKRAVLYDDSVFLPFFSSFRIRTFHWASDHRQSHQWSCLVQERRCSPEITRKGGVRCRLCICAL